MKNRGELLVVAGLGSTAWDITAAGDSPLSFPMWGAMGQAAMMGLGLALAQPQRRVLVITGDGEMLMGLGSLATIGVQQPANLSIVVIDNERYGETGMQATHTAHGIDLDGGRAAAAASNICPFENAAGSDSRPAGAELRRDQGAGGEDPARAAAARRRAPQGAVPPRLARPKRRLEFSRRAFRKNSSVRSRACLAAGAL